MSVARAEERRKRLALDAAGSVSASMACTGSSAVGSSAGDGGESLAASAGHGHGHGHAHNEEQELEQDDEVRESGRAGGRAAGRAAAAVEGGGEGAWWAVGGASLLSLLAHPPSEVNVLMQSSSQIAEASR